jgi:putative ABC transport system ATP-binding protein
MENDSSRSIHWRHYHHGPAGSARHHKNIHRGPPGHQRAGGCFPVRQQGEFIVIAGSSGSGKTTLLTLLSGLDHPTSGQVFIDGREITHASEEDLAPMRNRTIGFVFQSFHLVPSMTAKENIMFPAELTGDPDAAVRADRLLTRVGLSNRADNLPSQLSGGEKQRIAICRALINRPKLLFADEPTGNLDSENGKIVLAQLIDLKNEHGATLVLVTHNPEIARVADRVIDP